MSVYWKKFIKAALIRALRTFCQTAGATIGSSVFLHDVDWKLLLSASSLAAIFSLITSVVTGLPEVAKEEEIGTMDTDLNPELRAYFEKRLADYAAANLVSTGGRTVEIRKYAPLPRATDNSEVSEGKITFINNEDRKEEEDGTL